VAAQQGRRRERGIHLLSLLPGRLPGPVAQSAAAAKMSRGMTNSAPVARWVHPGVHAHDGAAAGMMATSMVHGAPLQAVV
jgi:hypothetical protein